MTTIAATVLAHDCGPMIGDAIASVVDQVDIVIVINTEAGGNPSLRFAREVAGPKYRKAQLTLLGGDGPVARDHRVSLWRNGWNGSFADARNFALRQAQTYHADWALTLDTDERIAWGDLALRATVETNPEYDVYLMWRDDRSYAKERLFRIPTQGRWIGRTHEAFVLAANNHRPALPYATFAERDKTPEQLAAKFARDEAALLKEIAEQPRDARWHYYLGATYHDTGRFEQAAQVWTRVAAMPGWHEQAAWAAYQAAVILNERLHLPQEARRVAAIGVGRMLTPELCWYLGFLAFKDDRPTDALLWGEQALAVATKGPARIFFRWAPAWAEKPYELLYHANQALGNDGDAAVWKATWDAAKGG
jgi:tetratricopeptide (TPR) repeat protein